MTRLAILAALAMGALILLGRRPEPRTDRAPVDDVDWLRDFRDWRNP